MPVKLLRSEYGDSKQSQQIYDDANSCSQKKQANG